MRPSLGAFGRIVTIGIGTAVLAAASVGGAYWRVRSWGQEQRTVKTSQPVEFKSGTTLSQLAQNLADQEVIDSPLMFHLYVKFFGQYRLFQAGLYTFEGEFSPQSVMEKIIKGDVYHPIALQLTIPEGFTLKNITERLAAHNIGHIVVLQNLVKDKAFLKKLNVDGPTLEGFIYPATYTFESLPSPTSALETMNKTFWQHLPKDYLNRISQKGLNIYQAVTFASLIELETQTEAEKPLISEVIWNRIKDKVPLGIDAAVIYGIPNYTGDIKWSHLSDAKNPYNTRIHVGLPPTPIGSPSASSLEAVLNPTSFGYYYYVLVPGTNKHHFSKTLKEHNEHVKLLVNALKSRNAHPSLSPLASQNGDAKDVTVNAGDGSSTGTGSTQTVTGTNEQPPNKKIKKSNSKGKKN